MLMRIEVIHTVFQVSLALGTIAELQIRIILLCSSADGALVVSQPDFFHLGRLHIRLEFLLSLNLPGADFAVISCHHKENHKIQQSQADTDPGNQASKQKFIQKFRPNKNSQPVRPDRPQKRETASYSDKTVSAAPIPPLKSRSRKLR